MPEMVLFEERQRMSPTTTASGLTLTAAVLGGAALLSARQGKLAEAGPVLLASALATAAIFAFIGSTSLVTRVTSEEAVVAFRPFKTLRLLPGDIGSVEMKSFGLFDGGVGYHIGGRSMALTAQTGTGVLITKPDGYRILVGTQHPDALLSALLRLQRAAAGTPGAAW